MWKFGKVALTSPGKSCDARLERRTCTTSRGALQSCPRSQRLLTPRFGLTNQWHLIESTARTTRSSWPQRLFLIPPYWGAGIDADPPPDQAKLILTAQFVMTVLPFWTEAVKLPEK